ncbi:pentapeptide repeat-containing protein [Edwardsiella anguillarum]|uniref:pentapeptide repeat-containing protein n=1 Tax=Edwardsiella anguillarum TaxID=1821960 RepID=UPI0024B6DC05|nr:pentapeptide repeat-containing protein [Edwardsiella anguillarum]WHQ17715.1 pentapeptide repeat-containing protein [Edwardsiella anguillarum]WHQ21252.1 pentapeptide repeat-containing protein [Edwardsiella anguillarum]WHQ24776.1 pentapeptide repeat-containing protein [Edwardsiella anguillarum]
MKYIIIVFFLYSGVIVGLSLYNGNYNSTFTESFLVNANSSILDFLVLGVILYYFENKRQNTDAIHDLIEDLENLAKHSSAELNIMKIKIIRQLNAKGIYNIQIPRIELDKMSTIKYLHFKDADLTGLNMSESYIRDCTFENCTIQALNITNNRVKSVKFINCKLKNIKASKAKLQNVVFESCSLEGGCFTGSDMKSCILKGCDFTSVTYEGAIMRNANIINALNINIQELLKAENLDYLICDKEIKNKIREEDPSIKISKGRYEVRESNPTQ